MKYYGHGLMIVGIVLGGIGFALVSIPGACIITGCICFAYGLIVQLDS